MPHGRQMVVTLITLALAVVLAACGGSGGADGPVIVEDERPDAPIDLDGTEWVLTSLSGGNLVEDSNITLTFAEGRAKGFAGCNNYGAEYTSADEGALTIPMIEITLQLCQTPEGIMQQEDAYIEALRNAATYRVMDNRLEIDDVSGETALVFTRKEELLMDPSDLVSTGWQLVSWNDNRPIEGSTITLVFHNENRVSGTAGCRGYVASYEASGDDIRFPFLGMLGSFEHCSEALMLQEGEYTTSLEQATNYHLREEPALPVPSPSTLLGIDSAEGSLAKEPALPVPSPSTLLGIDSAEGSLAKEPALSLAKEPALSLAKGQLEILTARGEVLVFEPLPEDANASLEGSTWALTAFIEERMVEEMSTPVLIPLDLLAETEITLTFDDGTASGSAGCNSYSSTYTLDGSFLTVGAVAATEMACLDPAGVMEQEQRYLGFLKDATVYHVYGSQLWLETGDGRTLVFTVPKETPSPQTVSPTSTPLPDLSTYLGLVHQGGELGKVWNLADVRYGLQPDRLRVVVEMAEPGERVPWFEAVEVDNIDSPFPTGHDPSWGIARIDLVASDLYARNSPAIEQLPLVPPDNPKVTRIGSYPTFDDACLGFSIGLKSVSAYEVYELTDPVRIVIDVLF